MLRDLGEVASTCQQWGMPLLAMMYVRGEMPLEARAQAQVTAARVAWELGADVVKLAYAGHEATFAEAVAGVGIPVVAAGGPYRSDTASVLADTRAALDAGAAGLAIGRNVFQHPERIRFARAVAALVHQDATPEDAWPEAP